MSSLAEGRPMEELGFVSSVFPQPLDHYDWKEWGYKISCTQFALVGVKSQPVLLCSPVLTWHSTWSLLGNRIQWHLLHIIKGHYNESQEEKT